MSLNPELIKLARFTVGKSRQKVAFQPPGEDPAAGGAPPGAPPMDPSMMGGAPPMDPSMMGGAMPPPPPGGPPMDPAAAGGAPPMDPSMGGAPPVPGAGGMTADTIRQIMQEVLGQMGMVPGAAGPGGGAAGGKPGKPDLLAMSMDLFQIKKMMSTLFNAMGIPMPQDILDGPNRDPASGAPMPPNTPGSTSDPNRQSPPVGGGAGPGSAIKPIGPIQGAFPAGGEGGESKAAASIGEQEPIRVPTTGRDVRNKAAALATVLRRRTRL